MKSAVVIYVDHNGQVQSVSTDLSTVEVLVVYPHGQVYDDIDRVVSLTDNGGTREELDKWKNTIRDIYAKEKHRTD